jgi:hypothetical protein
VIRNCGPDNVFPAVVECDPEDSTFYHTTYRINFVDEPPPFLCSLCPTGSDDILDLEVSNGFQTCGDLEVILSIAASQLICDDFLSYVNGDFDNTVLCCDSVDPPPPCSLCLGGNPIDPSALPAFGGNLTCGEYTDDANEVTNISSTCADLQSSVAPFCCTDLPGRCTLCPAGSTLGDPDFEPPFLNATCGEFNFGLGFIPSDDESCAGVQSSLGDILDYRALCGCSGVAPPEICSFCAPNDSVLNPEFAVPDADITCGGLDSLFPFITNVTLCNDLSEASPLCCTPPATGAPTAAPIAASTAAPIAALTAAPTVTPPGASSAAPTGTPTTAAPAAGTPSGTAAPAGTTAAPAVTTTAGTSTDGPTILTGTIFTGTSTAAPTVSSSYARTAWIATALVGGVGIFLAF